MYEENLWCVPVTGTPYSFGTHHITTLEGFLAHLVVTCANPPRAGHYIDVPFSPTETWRYNITVERVMVNISTPTVDLVAEMSLDYHSAGY